MVQLGLHVGAELVAEADGAAGEGGPGDDGEGEEFLVQRPVEGVGWGGRGLRFEFDACAGGFDRSEVFDNFRGIVAFEVSVALMVPDVVAAALDGRRTLFGRSMARGFRAMVRFEVCLPPECEGRFCVHV